MRVKLAYGPGTLALTLPDTTDVEILEKIPVAPLGDPEAALRAGLAHPLAARPLLELARGRRDAVIVVSDRTRPVPNALLLPPILEVLGQAGIPEHRIYVQVATGLHRPATGAELDQILGRELAARLRIVQHDARDLAAHRDLGRSRHGIPAWIDRFYLERDLRILTGLIEPHLMAGYSGGRKAVCPGLAATETIRVAHGAGMLERWIGPGLLADNPLHQDLTEIARRAGVDFIVNVALDRKRRVAGVYCGDLEVAFEAGTRFVEQESLVSIASPADLVIASGGGHPLDATFYQAIKGVAAASGIVRDGGTILLCASLSEGLGSASFEQVLRDYTSAKAFEARLLEPDFFAVDQWMAQHLCQAQRRARVLMLCEGLSEELCNELPIEVFRSAEQALEAALGGLASSASAPKVAVLPQGPYVLATVGGVKRPVGRGEGRATRADAH